MTLRYIVKVLFLRQLKTYDLESKNIASTTISHNLKGMKDLSVNRSNALVKPLSMIEAINFNAKILSIGPRTEGELYNLAANGFNLKNIRGLDLITYSKQIDLGDMHAMPYSDNQWDVVICGWVLAYSENKKKAAQEILRVCKPGGIIAIGVEYHPLSPEEIGKEMGYIPGSSERLGNLQSILNLFDGHIDHLYFSQEPTAKNANSIGSLITIFSKKS